MVAQNSHLNSKSGNRRCPGPLGRRELLKLGWGGFSSLSIPLLLKLRSAAAAPPSTPPTSIILVWLRGGGSHLDTFDPKPQSASEYRGPYQTIQTRNGDLHITELLPRLAQISNRYTLLRSMAHTGGGHPSGSLQVLSGDKDRQDKPRPVLPDFMSVAHYLRNDPSRKIPNYIGVNAVTRYDSFTIAGPAYLGPAFEPFKITGDPSKPQFHVPNVGLPTAALAQRLQRRVDLKDGLDRMSRFTDQDPKMHALDAYQHQALNLLTNPNARIAFDLNREPKSVRERYGNHQWGQQCLLARRLVEAGVEIITTTFDGPLCGRVSNWDDHAVNHHVFKALSFRAPYFDQAVSALIEDIYNRGMDRNVLVVVTGEFGRTPKISHVASSGGGVASAPRGTVQPGRDHWPHANTMLFSGGGLNTGQVIGGTDARGEYVTDRRVGVGDFLATIYRHLNIDYEHTMIEDFTGRPIPILNEGTPIPELEKLT
ncbi:MAG: DUF1501 domain-containing protein [Planctomycetes bacterium]|nr:DUF1501 domain-containing protein [Planctomycetota bacterium]